MKNELRVLGLIREDCKREASELDGLALNGKNVGTMFGNVLAAIDGLAGILESVIKLQDLLHQND